MDTRHPHSASSGFTLTELMIVVIIVGVLAAIALPSFSGLSKSQRIKTASFELYSLLTIARSEAIKRNELVTLSPVMSGTTVLRLEVRTSGGKVIHSKSSPAQVGYTVLPSGTTSVTFARTGRPTVSGITFQIDDEGAGTPSSRVRCIRVGLSGMPQTRAGACS